MINTPSLIICTATIIFSIYACWTDLKKRTLNDIIPIGIFSISAITKAIFMQNIFMLSLALFAAAFSILFLVSKMEHIDMGDVLFISSVIFALYGLIPISIFPLMMLCCISVWYTAEKLFHAIKKNIVLQTISTVKNIILLVVLLTYISIWVSILPSILAIATELTSAVLIMFILIISLIISQIFVDSDVEMLPLRKIDDTYMLAETIIITNNSMRREPKTGVVITRNATVISGRVTKQLKKELGAIAKRYHIKEFRVKRGTAIAPGLLIATILALIYIIF